MPTSKTHGKHYWSTDHPTSKPQWAERDGAKDAQEKLYVMNKAKVGDKNSPKGSSDNFKGTGHKGEGKPQSSSKAPKV
jgi:hypothetical protein